MIFVIRFVSYFLVLSHMAFAITFRVENNSGQTIFVQGGKAYTDIRFRIVNKEKQDLELDFINKNALKMQKLLLQTNASSVEEDMEATRDSLSLPESEWLTVYVTANCLEGGKQPNRQLLHVYTLKCPFPVEYIQMVTLTFKGIDINGSAILDVECLPDDAWQYIREAQWRKENHLYNCVYELRQSPECPLEQLPKQCQNKRTHSEMTKVTDENKYNNYGNESFAKLFFVKKQKTNNGHERPIDHRPSISEYKGPIFSKDQQESLSEEDR